MAPASQDTKFIDIFHSFFEGFNLARTKSLYLIVQALAAVSSINLTIAYTWMIRIGKWVKKKTPKLFLKKKHKRPGKSIFRAGLEEFIHSIYTINTRRMTIWLKFLSCT
jgi:hypothetical protein